VETLKNAVEVIFNLVPLNDFSESLVSGPSEKCGSLIALSMGAGVGIKRFPETINIPRLVLKENKKTGNHGIMKTWVVVRGKQETKKP
jgi:hypothetical protein